MLSLREKLEREVEISFIHAQGSGGQNVNKVASAVQLRFDVAHSQAISEHCRATILASGDARLTRDGVLVIKAQEHRTQAKNRDAALARLLELVQAASQVRKARRPTKPTRGSVARRLESKTVRAQVKRGRGKVEF